MKQLSLTLVLLTSFTLAANAELPKFSDYSRVEHSELRLGSIDFDSHPDAANFKTRLEEHIGDYPNFAGQFILTYWGCGTMCQMIALIDVETGRVFFPPELVSSLGVCFRESSSMLILNPADADFIDSMEDQIPGWFNIAYYRWNGEEAEHLLDSREPVMENCVF